ncbi:MAG: hypothetical protein IJ287_10640 [Methanobrevibacter sp.]|nr:hypothetical protein [Methanobrevibacter sp.]
MVSRLEIFKKEMQPSKELYTQEIKDFSKKFDVLGEMTVSEFPDIDTQEYLFSFEKLNGTTKSELDEIFLEMSNHMEEFSKIHGIEKFCSCAVICL